MVMVRRPSASALPRTLVCESSLVLPAPPEAPKAHNAPSVKGDRIHAALERFSLGARWEDVIHQVLPEDCYDLKSVAELLPKVTPIAGLPYVEVECWYNPLTCEASLGTAGVPRPPGWWRGKADMLGMYVHPLAGEVPIIEDTKTGNPRWQKRGDSEQIGYFICWLYEMLKHPPVMAGIIYVTQDATQPRVALWDEAAVLKMQKRLHNHEARLLLIEAGEAEPTLVKSKECTFCESKPVCPLWAGKEEGDDERVFV